MLARKMARLESKKLEPPKVSKTKVLEGKNKTKPSRKKTSYRYSKSSRQNVDILSSVAMENAYFICHSVADCLAARGFPWQGGNKKKKTKGKKKKKR